MKIFRKVSKKFKKSSTNQVPVTFEKISERSFPYYSLPPDNINYKTNSDSFESLSEDSLSESLKNSKISEDKYEKFNKMLFLASDINYSFQNVKLSKIRDDELVISTLTEIFLELKSENFTFRSKNNKFAKICASGSRGLKIKKYFK